MGNLTGFNTRQRLASAVLMALAFQAALSAGQPPPPPAPPVAIEAPKEEAKTVEDKPFVFEPRNRRDPFAFIKQVALPAEPPPLGDTTNPGEAISSVIDMEKIRQILAQAEVEYKEAESAFLDIAKDGKAQEVVSKCDKGLKLFADIPNPAAVPQLLGIREKLSDLRKAGDRIKQRQEADKRFRDVRLRLTGVVARDRGSRAIINGKILGKGEVLTAGENYNVVIEDIRSDRVVVISPEGYKMLLEIIK